jgi:hypothetical protein
VRIGSSLPSLPDLRRDSRGGGSGVSGAGSRADWEPDGRAASPRIAFRGTRELAALEESGAMAPRNRQALQAYFANQPTMGERLGVELAGVDVFV